MTKIFPQNRNLRKTRKTWIFIFAIFARFGATNGDIRSFAVKTIVGATTPFFKFSRFAVEKRRLPFFLFRNKQSLEEELNYLKEKKILSWKIKRFCLNLSKKKTKN